MIYLAALSVVGAMVVYLATLQMGPGVSTDSAVILSTAENLMRGRGLIDYFGRELTQFPPLYSIILALGAWSFKADVFVVGWVFNAVVFAGLIIGTGLLLNDAFGEQPILAYAGSFVVLTSTSLIQISANIASDPLFMLMVLAFLMTAAAYLRTGSPRYGILAGILTIVSCFQRYAGLALVITGGLVALYGHRNNLRRAVLSAASFMLVTAAPIYAWGYLHNRPYNGTVFGGRLPPVPILNFQTSVEKVLYWFIPHRLISAVGELPLLGLILGMCTLAVLLTGAARFANRLQRPAVVPNIAFLCVYGAVLVFNISFYELKGLHSDRVHIVALPAVLILLAALGDQFIETGKRHGDAVRLYGAIMAMFLIWTIYPISRSYEYVRESMAHGDVSAYNSINKAHVRDSAVAQYLSGPPCEGRLLYSNGGDTVWFITGSQVEALPTLRSRDRTAQLEQRFDGWPGRVEAGCIIWINAEAYKTNYATPTELSAIASVTELYRDEAASVYSVAPY